MSHLYNRHLQARDNIKKRQQQQSLLNNNNSSRVFRMSKRDVFSNEDCDESVGYPYARDTADQDLFQQTVYEHEHNDADSLRPDSESLRLISNHHGDNIHDSSYWDGSVATLEASFQGDEPMDIADDETLPVSTGSNHTRSVADSSSDMLSVYVDQNPPQRQWRSPESDIIHNVEEEQEQETSPKRRISSPSSSSSYRSSPHSSHHMNLPSGQGQSMFDVDLEEDLTQSLDNHIETGAFLEEQEKERAQHQKKLLLVATMALCLILLVAAATITWWVVGFEEDQKKVAAADVSPPTLRSPVPTPSPTTPVPTAAPTTFGIDQWAQQVLPTVTLAAIQGSNATSSSSPSAPLQAFEWIQTDPYFSSNTSHDFLTPDQLATKRLHRFGLATFYYATAWSDTDTDADTAWLSATDECEWPYYTCARTRRRQLQSTVHQGATLQLRNVHVTGSLPLELSLLQDLAVVAIYDNAAKGLQGTLPTHLGLLTDLTLLDLHNHQLTGAIPSELGLLTQLERLYLHDNAFSNVSIPTEICNLATLKDLSVDCLQVECHCGCQCPTGGTSSTTHGNIFDHPSTPAPFIPITTGPLTHEPTISVTTGPLTQLPATSLPISITTRPLTYMPTVNPPLPTLMPTAPLVTLSPTSSPIAVTTAPSTTAPTTVSLNETDFPSSGLSSTVAPSVNISSDMPFVNAPNVTIISNATMNVTTSFNTTENATISSDGTSAFDSARINATNATSSSARMLCNGLANTCDRRLPEVLIPMVHNAMATVEDGFPLSNHLLQVEKAVEAGFRGIGLDVCKCGDELVFCHNSCLLGSRDATPVFEYMHQFLLDNPHEILVFAFQVDPDADDTPIDLWQLYEMMQGVGNFTDYIYEHDDGPWPTLRTLIETDKRVVMFHFNGVTCDNAGECPNGLHYYFDYVAETEFSFETIEDLLNTNTSCRITRGGSGEHRAFFGINNFMKYPSELNAPTINSLDFVQSRVEACAQANGGIDVSFLMVDHWSIGEVLEFSTNYNRAL